MQNVSVLQVQQIDAETLFSKITDIIESRLNAISPPQSQAIKEEYLTREQVGKMFSVSTVTIWDWSRKGILKAYRIGNKVRYLKSEVLLCPRPIYDTKEGVNNEKAELKK